MPQELKSIYKPTKIFLNIFGPQHNSKTQLCHGPFQCKNEIKLVYIIDLKRFVHSNDEDRIELDMLICTLSIVNYIYV